ncbi:TPA: hypothetical protein ACG1QB_004191 [Enterobacter asburiae]
MPEDKRPLLSLKRPAGKVTPEKAPTAVQVRPEDECYGRERMVREQARRERSEVHYGS